jgi:hypothetical protein
MAARGKISTSIALSLFFMITRSASLHATTVGFDDVDASAGDVILDSLNPYQGYTWTNFSVYTDTPGFPGFNNGIVSAPNAAYTAGDDFGSPIVSSITAASPFNFLSGYFGSGWYDGLNVTIDGLDSGKQEFSKTITVDTEGTQLVSFDFTDITELDIFSTLTASTTDPYGCGPSGCSQVTLDNLTLTPAPSTSAVPEPSIGFFVGAGALALAAAQRLSRSRRQFSN